MTAFPRVTVVLLNYRGWADTIACLESVLRLEYPAFRVVVCDNASGDDSVERITEWARGGQAATPAPSDALRALVHPPVLKPVPIATLTRAQVEQGVDPGALVTLVQTGANDGFAAGNNVALRWLLARDESGFAWLLNNDTLVAPDTLARLVATASGRDVGAVGATVLEYATPDTAQMLAGGAVTMWCGRGGAVGRGVARDAATRRPARVDYVSGCSTLVPLDVVRAVGLLDERFFMYNEDVDWSVRIRAAGYRLVHAPDALVWHKGGAASRHGSTFHDYQDVRSLLLFVRKHRPLALPAAFAYTLYRCALPKLVRRQWPRLRAVGRAYRQTLLTRQA